jgi:hypothetical protein
MSRHTLSVAAPAADRRRPPVRLRARLAKRNEHPNASTRTATALDAAEPWPRDAQPQTDGLPGSRPASASPRTTTRARQECTRVTTDTRSVGCRHAERRVLLPPIDTKGSRVSRSPATVSAHGRSFDGRCGRAAGGRAEASCQGPPGKTVFRVDPSRTRSSHRPMTLDPGTAFAPSLTRCAAARRRFRCG